MRVVCSTIDEFLHNLQDEGREKVYRGIVYVSTTRNPLIGTRLDAVKWSVNFQVSAIIDVDDESQYLLEAGEDCGTDYLDGEPTLDGSDYMNGLREKVTKACEELGLVVRPGIVNQ